MRLRPMRTGDERAYHALRRRDRDWLAPWDATAPDDRFGATSFRALVRSQSEAAARGQSLPCAIEVDGAFVGQVTGSSIVYGAFRSMSVGYWVTRAMAGRAIAPTAVAMLADHAVAELGLHRVEINVRPENTASLAVVRKLGFREEGLRRRMLHIDGAWRDHRSFALTVEDLEGATFVERLTHLSHQPLQRHTDVPPGPSG